MRPRRRRRRPMSPAATLASLFWGLALLGTVGLSGGWRWHLLPAWLLGINVATFLAYAYDKRAARVGVLRVPEAALHGMALLGGSPAALIAQRVLRHKTAKQSFQLVYAAIVVAQLLALGYLAMRR